MEVILSQDVNKIGRAGQVVKVKDGFARNFLIPNKLAIIKSAGNLKKLEQEKTKKALELDKLKKEAESLKAKIDGLSLTIPVLTQESDGLYGSIGVPEIISGLKEEGLDINKNYIALDEPIKSLGIYEIPVKLHPEVSATIKVWVVKK